MTGPTTGGASLAEPLFPQEDRMSKSYFSRKARQCHRHAGLILEPQIDCEELERLGDLFSVKAAAAVTRLAKMRSSAARRRESERQALYWDSRE